MQVTVIIKLKSLRSRRKAKIKEYFDCSYDIGERFGTCKDWGRESYLKPTLNSKENVSEMTIGVEGTQKFFFCPRPTQLTFLNKFIYIDY